MATTTTKSIANLANQIKTTVARLNTLIESGETRGLQINLQCEQNVVSIGALSHKVEQDFLAEIDVPAVEEEEETTEEE